MASAGETKTGLDEVSNGILQLAGQVGYSAQQLSDAMYTVEKAGYRGAEGVNVLKAAAQGAKSENADLKEVLSGVTTTLSDFGLSATKPPTHVEDGRRHRFGENQLPGFRGRAALRGADRWGGRPKLGRCRQAAPPGGRVRVVAQLTQSGMGAAQAGQNLGRAFTTMSSPTQKMRDELGQLGLNAEDLSQHLGDRGMAGTLQIVSEAIRSKMNPAGQVVIDTFLKSEQPPRRPRRCSTQCPTP